MKLIRRTEFPAFSSFQDEMNDLMSRFAGGSAFPDLRAAWWPAVNVEDSEKEVIVTAELPGIDPKDISLAVEGRELVMTGERKSTSSERKGNFQREEICCGSFQRRIGLPADVAVDKAAADYKGGMLRVTLPKVESSKRSRIPVNAGKE